MPVGIQYDVDGLEAVEHRMLALGYRAVDTEPMLELFARQLEKDMTARFAAEGEGEWAPLAESTIARKGNSTIGRETDAMMEALTSENAEGALREIFGDELVFGINLTTEDGVPYPVIFNDGQEGQPARPLFHISEFTLKAFTKNVHAYLMAADKAEFGLNLGGDNITGSDLAPSSGSQIFADF